MIFRLHGRSPPTYESGGTRQFILGRTETIRSATIESDTFARAMSWPTYSVSKYNMSIIDEELIG